MQKRAAASVTSKYDYRAIVTEMMETFGWLIVERISEYIRCILFYVKLNMFES